MHILTAAAYPFLQNRKFRVFPKKGLERLRENEWHAVDDDPQFEIKGFLRNFLSGWVSIRVKMLSSVELTPKIYLDFGDGYSESRAICMQLIEEDTYQAECVFPAVPKHIRFDPHDHPCSFTLCSVQVKVHSEILHIFYQGIAIIKHDHQKGEDPFRILKKSHVRYKKHGLPGAIERLEKEYKILHPFKMHRSTPPYIEYLHWIKQNEQNRLEQFREEQFAQKPLISIVMTTYNTPIEFLKSALDSVCSQIYPYWELCIADDASTKTEVHEVLKAYVQKDEKIRVVFRKINGHVSLASNTALSLAKGKYVAFMDHDDKLAPNALMEVVKCLNQNPEAKLIYSDEDKIDEKDRRYDPHFKSGWNPDMFYSQNYISHLSVIERKLVEEVGMLREGYEGAQDYELLLRVPEKLSEKEIVHIEKILYHWRAFDGSTAFDPEAKSYTSEAGLKALKDYFSSKETATKVEMGMVSNTYKVSYSLTDDPLVTIIIPTKDGYDILSLCIQSILEKTSYKNYEIIIVDNQTTCHQTLAYLEELSNTYKYIRILKYDEVFNYSAINNFAVYHASGEVIALVNNDVEVISEHWLKEMVQHAIRHDIGAVGAKLYYDNDTIQHAGVVLGIGGVAGHSHKYFKKEDDGYFSRLKIIQNYSAVTGACLVVRKELYTEVGGLDETNLEVAFNDVDFCLKLLGKGYRNVWTPYVELYHHESISRGAEDNPHKVIRFNKEVSYMKKKWKNRLKIDKMYNRHLTNIHENFKVNI